MINVDPWPTLLSTSIVPPSNLVHPLVIGRPSPVPWYCLSDPSTCQNSSKMESSAAAGMPIPVSETATTRYAPSCTARMRTSPASVNFSALLSRLWYALLCQLLPDQWHDTLQVPTGAHRV